MEVKRSNGHTLVEPGIWLNHDTYKYETAQDLIPTDWPLEFHKEFILECATNPSLDCIGIYTNGWEL